MSNDPQSEPHVQMPPDDPVWTFRGYQLRSSEFNTAIVHYYRAEVQRSNVWRTRLDTTTNWAVVATAAAITIAFSGSTANFVVIVLDSLLVFLFLWIEARRYRYYELWSLRVRLMETDFYAAMLVPPFRPSPGWAETMAETLLQPEFPISTWEALGRRLRNNYLWIFLILAAAMVAKLAIFPTPANSVQDAIDRASLGPAPGELVLGLYLAFVLAMVVIALATRGLTQATGEVLPKYHMPDLFNGLWPGNNGESGPSDWRHALKNRMRRRPQLLALVVANNPEAIADRVIKEMSRGVTALHGRGMYLKQDRDVLTIGLTVTEIEHLKRILREEDEHAFMTIMPAREIVGEGFVSLEDQ